MKSIFFFHECPRCAGTKKELCTIEVSPKTVDCPAVIREVHGLRFVGVEKGKLVFSMTCLASGETFRFYHKASNQSPEDLAASILRSVGLEEGRKLFDEFMREERSFKLCNYIAG
jgi:hypothetical protein